MDTNLATKRERFHLLLLLLTNVTISVLLIAKYRSGEINRTNAILSAAFCMVFLNAVMLVAFWKSAAKTGDTLSAKLWVAAAAFALCGFSITSLVVAQSPHHDRDVELALSDTPLSSIQPEKKRLLVELIRQTAANSRENDKLLADAREHPLNPQVYTPESFANTAAMQQVVDRLTSLVQTDSAYAAKQVAAKQHYRDQMASVDPVYLKGWNDSMRPLDEAMASTEKIQQDWLVSVVSLYGYAQQHSQEISVKDGKVQLTSSSDGANFQQQLQDSQVIYQDLTTSVQKELEIQKQSKADLLTR